jgi:signal peptidase
MKTKKLLSALPYVFLIVAFLLVFNVVFALTNGDVPSFFGYSISSVQTGSMAPTILQYDVIFVKRVDAATLEKDDIITFWADVEVDVGETTQVMHITVTHRILDVIDDEDGLRFITKGDANNVQDDWEIAADDIIGVYVGRSAVFGYFYRIVTAGGTAPVYLGAIVVFLLIAITEGASIVKAVGEQRRKELEAERKRLLEEAKEELRNQITQTKSDDDPGE